MDNKDSCHVLGHVALAVKNDGAIISSGGEKISAEGVGGGTARAVRAPTKFFVTCHMSRQGVKKKSLVKKSFGKKRLVKKRFGKKSWRKRSERVFSNLRGEELQTRAIPSTWVTICSRSRAANKWFCCKTLVCVVTKDC